MAHWKTTLLASLSVWALIISCASAHEYYLMPKSFSPKAADNIEIEHRLGQKFKGNQLPWVDRWNVRSELWIGEINRPVTGKDGDQPALAFVSNEKQLMTIIHQSNIEHLTFKTWEKFTTYVTKEGLGHITERHQESGKELAPIKEIYSRYAKTLVTPDQTINGKDLPTGLTIELLALSNPNSLAANEPMPVQLLYKGKPLSGAMIKVFVGINTEAAYRILTNAEGKAGIPARGPGPYLLNAIHMTKPQSRGEIATDADWESFWASMTFQRPN